MSSLDHDGRPVRSQVAPWASEQAQARLRELELALPPRPGPASVLATVNQAIAAHHRDFDETGIVLYAGTNVLSEAARSVYDAGLATRPSMGWPGEKFQAGLDHIDILEVLAPALVAELMGGTFAEVRLQSATLANLAVYGALTEPGDTIAVLPEAAGGHTSHHASGVPRLRGLNVIDLPYDADRFDLDYAALPDFLARHHPRLVVIGGSLMLFALDVPAVVAAARAVDAYVVYDASHVAGLIAAGQFQRPLADGAHVLTFSTYKSFGGPPGGCVVTRREDLAARISTTAYPGMLANYEMSRLAPLAVTAAELAVDGPDYARRCMANARALAVALHAEGLAVCAVRRGFTASHHVAIDAAGFGGGAEAANRLARAGIYLSGIELPYQSPDEGMLGLRLGTQEVTRRGMQTHTMTEVARLIRRCLADNEPPERIRADAASLR